MQSRQHFQHLVQLIEKLQSGEKEKLLLIAALHLEQMKEKLPDLQDLVGSQCEIQNKYLKEKIAKIEESISDHTEEILCYRIELLENNDIQS